ncbi:MAG: SURF2 Surfeit locus protein 2 [Gordonibacter sp.]|nr:SURF2 Surfeit locus protein 2 [Gordonibacter sp.]
MADEKTFSHITVSADDEDDFVIQAGVRPAQPQHSSPLMKDEACCEPAPAREAPVLDAATDGFSVTKTEKPSPTDKNTYEETTLEDLKGSSMPAAQKAVLAAAFLLVIAFVVYYLFLR